MKKLPIILGGLLCAWIPANSAGAATAGPATAGHAPSAKAAGSATFGEISVALASVKSDLPEYAALAIGLMLMGRQMRRRSGPQIVPS